MNALIIIFFITYGLYCLFYNFKFWVIYLGLLGIYYLLTNVVFFNDRIESIRKKITIATWGTPYDPQTYASATLDISKMEPYLEKKSQEIGEKVTLTIFIIKLMSLVLQKYPELYSKINLGKVNDSLIIVHD